MSACVVGGWKSVVSLLARLHTPIFVARLVGSEIALCKAYSYLRSGRIVKISRVNAHQSQKDLEVESQVTDFHTTSPIFSVSN